MLIATRTFGFSPTEAILRHVEARMESALGAYSRHVFKVTVRLADVNAVRGGVDKRCQVVVALRGGRTEVVDAIDADLYTSIDTAANRIRSAVASTVERHLSRERHDPQMPAAFAGA